MVALDCSEPLLKMDEPSNQELKKSKKKKKNKHKDSESPKDDSIKIAKAHAMNEMNSHVENLSKKKKHKKSKCTEESSIESNEKDKKMQTDQDVEPTKKHKKKKKEKRQKDKLVTEILEQESNDYVASPNNEKPPKRKHTDTVVESAPNEENGSSKQDEGQPQKKKHKKNKKSKGDKAIDISDKDYTPASSMLSNDTSAGTNKNEDKSDQGQNSNIEEIKKKKKKEKKAKNELNNEPCNKDAEAAVCNQQSAAAEDGKSFKRDFYSKSYSSAPHDQEKESALAEEYRKAQRITMYGKGKSEGLFHPIRDFAQLGFEKNLLEAVKKFKEPTPIQASSWPVIASGRDTIGIAETGSGKTLAFSIPAFAHIRHRLDKEQGKKYLKRKGPIMLVVAPTRELAQQSQDVVEAAGKTCGIRSVSVYGGVSKDSQRRSLSANGGVPYEVVIATPGKLKNYSISNNV